MNNVRAHWDVGIEFMLECSAMRLQDFSCCSVVGSDYMIYVGV
jgi:hypothetical protein